MTNEKMKNKITVGSTYDRSGLWMLEIKKEKGKLTLDEIIDACKDYENDYYGLIVKAIDEDMEEYYEDDLPNDRVQLYRITDWLEYLGKVKVK